MREREERKKRENFLSPYSTLKWPEIIIISFFLPYLTPNPCIYDIQVKPLNPDITEWADRCQVNSCSRFEWFLVIWLVLQHWILQKISKDFQKTLSLKPDFPSMFPIFSTNLIASISSVQFSSVTQSCLTLSNPMDCSRPGVPVHHQLLQLAQTHVHRVGDAIQPSHPLSSPSPTAFNLSQHQGLFQGVISFHQMAKVLELPFQ